MVDSKGNIVAALFRPWQTPAVLFTMGDVVKKLRDRLGWTQAKLAKRASVSLSTVQNLEADKNVQTDNVAAIAKALGE